MVNSSTPGWLSDLKMSCSVSLSAVLGFAGHSISYGTASPADLLTYGDDFREEDFGADGATRWPLPFRLASSCSSEALRFFEDIFKVAW